ncbi:PKD domain-containing protein [Albibacterium profundi]|uniref:PKD domain-containing protein n=1 Tax=Albibacterium profundi TaxID=3134906 RepID=A0ABV5CH24_9SPHI
MKNRSSFLMLFVLLGVLFQGCKSEDPPVPEPEVPKPTAAFTFEQVEESDPFTFHFENQSKDYEIVRWEFGDDSSSLDVSPTHTFLKTGEFTVKMNTQNSQGYWAQKEVVIDISPDSVLIINTELQEDGSLNLSLSSNIETDSLFWYKGIGTAAELIHQGPVANIEVASGQFQDYTLRVKTPKGSIAEISKLLTDIGIVRDVTDAGNLSVSRDNNGGPEAGEGSLKLVDNNTNTKFLQFDYVGDLWYQLEYFQPQVIGAYTFTSANDAQQRDPKNWTLQASNDGEEWVVLDTRTDEVFEDRFMTRIFTFDNTEAYLFYRVYVTEVGSGGLFQLAEWRMLQLPQETTTGETTSE